MPVEGPNGCEITCAVRNELSAGTAHLKFETLFVTELTTHWSKITCAVRNELSAATRRKLEFKTMKQTVYDYLLSIPKGKVVTYGQIAAHLGNKNLARAVGNILHSNPHPEIYPCYKVVNAQGRLSSNFGWGGIDRQKALLEQDGIQVVNYAVDLETYGWL